MTEVYFRPETRRVCVLSGLEEKRRHLIELRDCEKSLELAIQELMRASKDEAFWAAMEMSARFLQLSCELTLALIASAPGVGPAGVMAVYDVSKIVVKAMNGELTVSDAYWYSTKAKLVGIAEHLKNSSGNARYGRALGAATSLVDVSAEVWGAWQGSRSARHSSFMAGPHRTAVAQLMRVRQKIADTRRELAACGLEGS